MKKILTIILTVIIAVGAVFAVGCSSEERSNTSSNNENVLRVQSVRMAMAAPMTVTAADGTQYIEKSLTAIVSPSTAPNRKVDFSVMWGENASRVSEPISDYITVVQESDGSATAKVRCHKSFGDDKIIIKVITRDGGFTDMCTVSFVGFCSDIEFDTSSLTVKNDASHGGEYVLLRTNNSYSIPIAPTNIFNDATANFVIKSGWKGQVIAALGGFSPQTFILEDEENKGYSNYFSVDLQGNNLRLTINEFSIAQNAEFYPGVGVNPSGWNYLFRTIPDGQHAYFYVLVEDTLTGNTKELKFWIEATVNLVSLDTTTMTFSEQ